jgi:malate synthase
MSPEPATKPKIKPNQTLVNAIAQVPLDDLPINMTDLAKAMRVSRWTISKWVDLGYEFEFGKLTTAAHCRDWLRQNAQRLKSKRKAPNEEDARLEAKLAELN